jgi:hypothetical protein
MKRTPWRAAAVFTLCLAAAAVWLTVRAARAPEQGGELQAPTAEAPPGKQLVPKAVLDRTTHHFGTIPPEEEVEHVFILRNEGDAPLKLARGSTSCKCTMSDLPPEPIPPGGAAEIRVGSKIRGTEGEFSHSANIHTNDPENPTVTLRLWGVVRHLLDAHPRRIVLSGVRRRETATVPVTLYSQVWDGLIIDGVASSLEGITWTVGPAEPELPADREARCARRLLVDIPAAERGGDFWEWLEVTARPADGSAPARTVKVDVTGTALSRIAVYGNRLDGDRKVIRLGTLRRGEGTHERLTMTVRDQHRELTIREVTSDPEFVQVRVEPYTAEAAKAGLYRIDVEVPPDAPPGNFLSSDKTGRIRIVTDHPDVPEVTLGVAFAVTGR